MKKVVFLFHYFSFYRHQCVFSAEIKIFDKLMIIIESVFVVLIVIISEIQLFSMGIFGIIQKILL